MLRIDANWTERGHGKWYALMSLALVNMISDEYVKHLADLSQLQATVPESMKYSAHFEYRDLCHRLQKAQRELEHFFPENDFPAALTSVRNHKLRIGAVFKNSISRSKSTTRPKPEPLNATRTFNLHAPVKAVRRRNSKQGNDLRDRLNSSARLDSNALKLTSLSPTGRKPRKAEISLNRSFTTKQPNLISKSLKVLGAGGTRSLFRLKATLKK